VQQELLTHHLTVKVAPSHYTALTEASEREGVSVGAIVRRAIRADLSDAPLRETDPYAVLPYAEVEALLNEAILAETEGGLLTALGDEAADLLEGCLQTLDVLHDHEAPQQLERAAGYLQQISLSVLNLAYRVRSLRVRRALADGELERIEARMRAEGHPEERN